MTARKVCSSSSPYQILETYLRAYVNFKQDNWAELLLTAQIAYNTIPVKLTGVSPFFANYGQEPDLRQGPPLNVPWAEVQANRLQELEDHLRAELKFTRERIKRFTDKYHPSSPQLMTTNEKGNFVCPDSSQTTRLYRPTHAICCYTTLGVLDLRSTNRV